MSYQLVIAEKPSVARSIAGVIGADKKQDGYMEGNGYLVSWCIGHLVSLADAGTYDERFKKWRYDDLPILPQEWQYIIPDDKKKQFDTLRSLMERPDVTGLVCATDAGREGELIFRFVYQMAGCKKPFQRLWISSMEDAAIKDGFAHLKPGADYDNLYQSALCRAQADWLVGINATRLFSILYHKTLTVGRVQTPTLKMLVDREAKISSFQKEKYHIVQIAAGGMEAASERIGNADDAKALKAACETAQAVCVSVTREKKTEQPPRLYDLTTLQREANRLFGFTAKQTLDYAQQLYEKKLLTYPRTDSQYLTDDMLPTAESLVSGLWPLLPFVAGLDLSPQFGRVLNSKKVSDHHAIVPTMEFVQKGFDGLTEGEKKLLSLVCCKLLCAVAAPHVYEAVTATFTCAGNTFTAKGKTILTPGWKELDRRFKASFKTDADDTAPEPAQELPKITEGQTFDKVTAAVTEHFTTPPKSYTEDTLLSAMERAGADDLPEDAERQGLGTPATRASILEKLVQMGFVERRGKQLLPTKDGHNLACLLPEALTKGLHLDGLADTADGFLSGRSRERKLEIMRDSRTGSMGVAAIFALLGMKFALFASLPPELLPAAAGLMMLGGRSGIVLYIGMSRYARPDGMGAIWYREKPFAGILLALLLPSAAGWFFFGVPGCFAGLALAVFAFVWSRITKRVIGGATGDTIGCCEELSELLILAGALAVC